MSLFRDLFFDDPFFRDPFGYTSRLWNEVPLAIEGPTQQNQSQNQNNNGQLSNARRDRFEALWRGPRVDFTETDKNYVIKADLPGLDKKDVNISVQDDVLTISGERKNEREETDDKRHLVERSYGKFSRSIRLPIDVQVDDAAASMEHGVLQITLGKKANEEAKKSITIA
ncbi:Heat shock protein HSP 90-beta [Gaertneriomyces sp. JEL0708]|nr:Heat shock protein HSP 90-beta [Gaertneriomyces sp. JEL0708]